MLRTHDACPHCGTAQSKSQILPVVGSRETEKGMGAVSGVSRLAAAAPGNYDKRHSIDKHISSQVPQ